MLSHSTGIYVLSIDQQVPGATSPVIQTGGTPWAPGSGSQCLLPNPPAACTWLCLQLRQRESRRGGRSRRTWRWQARDPGWRCQSRSVQLTPTIAGSQKDYSACSPAPCRGIHRAELAACLKTHQTSTLSWQGNHWGRECWLSRAGQSMYLLWAVCRFPGCSEIVSNGNEDGC